jgi:hypothetical protein
VPIKDPTIYGTYILSAPEFPLSETVFGANCFRKAGYSHSTEKHPAFYLFIQNQMAKDTPKTPAESSNTGKPVQITQKPTEQAPKLIEKVVEKTTVIVEKQILEFVRPSPTKSIPLAESTDTGGTGGSESKPSGNQRPEDSGGKVRNKP